MGGSFRLARGLFGSRRSGYLLRYTRDFPLAVVEAKAAYKTAADGMQQAKLYAEMLGVKFAYATCSAVAKARRPIVTQLPAFAIPRQKGFGFRHHRRPEAVRRSRSC
jgi:hypothetical protein